jgi:hypothetical protein
MGLARPLQAICSNFDLVHAWGATTLLLRVKKGVGDQHACDAIRAYSQAPWGDRLFRAVDRR